MVIRLRQSRFGDDAWVQLQPLSTTNFSRENPYGQKLLDTEIYSGDSSVVWKVDLEKSGFCSKCDLHVYMPESNWRTSCNRKPKRSIDLHDLCLQRPFMGMRVFRNYWNNPACAIRALSMNKKVAV